MFALFSFPCRDHCFGSPTQVLSNGGGGRCGYTKKKKRGKLPSKTGFRNVHFANQFHPLAGGTTLARMRNKRKDIMLGGGEIPLGKEKENQNKLTYCRKTNSPPFPSSSILLDEKNEKKTPSRDFIYIFVRNNLKIIAALGFFRPCATLPPRFGWMPISHWPH